MDQTKVIIDSDIQIGSTWSATNRLRYKKKNVILDSSTVKNWSVLQQEWVSDTGARKWIDVPTEE